MHVRPHVRPHVRLLAALAAVPVVAAACGGVESEQIVVSGSSTVEPISALNAELFARANPGVAVTVDGPGTGDGFELFCNGETDISDASRPIKEEEIEICEANGIDHLELKIAIDGISVLTSPENGLVDCLAFGDLYALLGPESEGFDTWSDADELGEAVGAGHVPYPDLDLRMTAPGEESGTYDSFVELAVEDLAGERGHDAVTRKDYTASPNDNVIVEGITGSRGSLGWVGYAFYVENQGQVKALDVANDDGACVTPTDEAIANGEYPLSRALYIYVNMLAAAENEAVSGYVDFYLSDEGRESVSEVGYVQLADDEWQDTIETWQEARPEPVAGGDDAS